MTIDTYKKNRRKSGQAIRNYYVDIISLLPFLLLLFTGVILLIYHKGKPYQAETLSISGYSWLIVHKIVSVASFFMVAIHLTLHLNWLKKLFTRKLKNKHKGKNITLFILFFLTVLPSALSWLIINDTELAKGLRGIHNKLGILLIILFVIHFINYFNWIITMTKRIMKN